MIATILALLKLSMMAVFVAIAGWGLHFAGTDEPAKAQAPVLAIVPSVYPNAATPETASSGNVAAASAVATLAASATKTTYITGFQCTAAGATVGADVTITVAGVITGTMSYTLTGPAGVTTGANPVVVSYNPAVPASAVNTTIVVTMPSLGTGNTNATCSAQGFQQ